LYAEQALSPSNPAEKRAFPITRRRAITMLAGAGTAALFGRPVGHVALSAIRDRDTLPPPREGFAEDASRLDEVPVDLHVLPAEGFEEALGALLARARAEGKAVSIAGARHTMGGHTSYPNGMVVDTSQMRAMRIDRASGLLTVQSGARWADVLAYLDP